MDRAFRHRVAMAHASIVLVIVLGAATAIVGLQFTRHQADQARAIDDRLAMLEQLRGNARELATSARRYVLGGDVKEQQRVIAISEDMRKLRMRLDARIHLAKGAVLEADLAEYTAALYSIMGARDPDPIARLERFEDELVRIRAPLVNTFDEVTGLERSRLDVIRSSQTLARRAQWAVLIASTLGALLAIGAAVMVLRRLAPVDVAGRPLAPLGRDPAPNEPSLLR